MLFRLTIVNNSAVQPNLENFRHHFSQNFEIEHIISNYVYRHG